ncbi:hypothetical protein Tco_0861545 [Tanacetum coccineum]|uniref:Xylulose kinase-1 n=1 Tax=Tanacetum coccineum TaxID=301880 RepID=A0ABQ5BL36_9ASTR
MVAYLERPTDSDDFTEIVDFLNANPIRYALTINPTIYVSCIEQFWSTAKAQTINEETQIHALVDGKKIVITESSVRRDLQFADEDGTDCLPTTTIFENLKLMGYENLSDKLTFFKSYFSHQWKFLVHTILQCLSPKKTAWNEFSSNIASAIICLATNQKFNFSKMGMTRNLDSLSAKFLMYPSLERGCALTTSSLEAEHVSGNITKTQSKATLNEPTPQETGSVSGPRLQDTMGDTIARTRFENVSKTSYDSQLRGVNTPRSEEDSMQLKELMEMCTNLLQRIQDFQTTKTAQAKEMTSLKKMVKKLEQRGRSRTPRLKRLEHRRYFTGSEDAGIQGGHDMADQEVNVAKKEVSTANPVTTAGEVVTTASVDISTASVPITVSTATPTTPPTTTTEDDMTLAETLMEIKSAKPKAIGVVMQEPTLRAQEIRNKPPTKMQKRTTMCNYLKNMAGYKHNQLRHKSFDDIQKLFDKALKRVNIFVPMDTEKVEGSKAKAVRQEWKKVQREQEKNLIENPQRSKRADGSTKVYMRFEDMLKMFDREDLEVLYINNKEYPFAQFTYRRMWEGKLRVDYECEMAFELLRRQKQVLKTENPGKRIAFLENKHSNSFAKCLGKEAKGKKKVSVEADHALAVDQSLFG